MSDWSSIHKYTEENVKKYVPTSGGVYRLIYKEADSEKLYVFYVGQAENLERRLLEHLSVAEPDTCIKRYLKNYSCYFRYLEVPSQSERDRIEKHQISEFDPHCNG